MINFFADNLLDRLQISPLRVGEFDHPIIKSIDADAPRFIMEGIDNRCQMVDRIFDDPAIATGMQIVCWSGE